MRTTELACQAGVVARVGLVEQVEEIMSCPVSFRIADQEQVPGLLLQEPPRDSGPCAGAFEKPVAQVPPFARVLDLFLVPALERVVPEAAKDLGQQILRLRALLPVQALRAPADDLRAVESRKRMHDRDVEHGNRGGPAALTGFQKNSERTSSAYFLTIRYVPVRSWRW